MSEQKKLALANKEPSLKSVVDRVGVRTHTETRFTSHLQDLLKNTAKVDEAGGSGANLTYGHSILASVVYERYDQALDELDMIMGLGQDYPEFSASASRFIRHAKSLVKALKAKRMVGKLPHVSRAKQKELIQHLTLHFNDLRACVINIEKIERRVRREDLSSTRYFMVALYWSFFATFMGAFLVYGAPLYSYSIHSVFTDAISSTIIFFVSYIWPF